MRWRVVCLIVFAAIGCSDSGHGPVTEVPATPAASSSFNAAVTGTITGRVRWTGAIPPVPTIDVERRNAEGTEIDHLLRLNPHAPVIDPGSNGLVGAVVFLRGVDSAKARPWDHAPVTIEVRDDGPIVRQGDAPAGVVGIVRQGDAVTMTSKQSKLHSVRARGAAFFTLMLPVPDSPRQRHLNEVGRVELSSAHGYTSMRGHLFVSDHPYYATTDAAGRFQLAQVPAGKYELICWRPDWRIERQERDPETLIRVRLFYLPPKELSVPVTVQAGETATLLLEAGAE